MAWISDGLGEQWPSALDKQSGECASDAVNTRGNRSPDPTAEQAVMRAKGAAESVVHGQKGCLRVIPEQQESSRVAAAVQRAPNGVYHQVTPGPHQARTGAHVRDQRFFSVVSTNR